MHPFCLIYFLDFEITQFLCIFFRHAGVHAKISKLLVMFQSNAWAVHLNRDNFSEHDVANALKRFFRTLNEPLLTERLRPLFLQAAAIGKKQHALIIQDQFTFCYWLVFFLTITF